MFLEEIYENSRRLGQRTALAAGEQEICWGQLWPMAMGLAARLRRQGTGPVALDGGTDLWVPTAMVACLIAGRPYLPLHPALPPAARRQRLTAARAQLLTREEAQAGFASGEVCPVACDPDREIYRMYTSGSTGVPKPIAITQRNLESFLRWARRLPEIQAGAEGVAVGQASYAFDLSVADLYLALTCGGTHRSLTESEKSDPVRRVERLTGCGLSLLVTTPSFLRVLLTDRLALAGRLEHFRAVFCCGEELPPAVARRFLETFPHVALYNAYGPTEATCAVSAARITLAECGGPLPIGRLDGCAVAVTVEGGEIFLQGESVAPAFGGIYATGDLGRTEGEMLYWLGRKDHQLKYKGYRVEPAEIERALESLPGVERAAVVPRRGGGDIRGLVAFIVGESGADGLAAALSQRLPSYMIPGQWRSVARLPLTPNGKCDRKLLEEMV